MTPEQFKINYNHIKDLIKGHGPEIANGVDMPYNAYYNVIRGQVTDPDKIAKVWSAMKEKADELIAGISEI